MLYDRVSGRASLIDFGLSSLGGLSTAESTAGGDGTLSLVGSPAWHSPELLVARQLDRLNKKGLGSSDEARQLEALGYWQVGRQREPALYIWAAGIVMTQLHTGGDCGQSKCCCGQLDNP